MPHVPFICVNEIHAAFALLPDEYAFQIGPIALHTLPRILDARALVVVPLAYRSHVLYPQHGGQLFAGGLGVCSSNP